MPCHDQRMTDVQRAGLGRPAIVAIAFAIVALVTSVVAVVVVMKREPRTAAAPGGAPRGAAAPVRDRSIAAADVLKLKRDVVEKVEANGTFVGIKITDEPLRTALALEPDDIITAINGRAIKREFDVFDAVLNMSAMNASILYLEVTRDSAPSRLVRIAVDGELRTARRDPFGSRPDPYASPRGNPFVGPADPLVDSIKRIDDLHYEVPRSSFDQLLANPDALARQARIVPAITNGQPFGLKLYAIRPGSIYLALGLRNGDTLRSINGVDLSTPDTLATLKDATALQILVVRRTGVEETLVITIK